MRRMREGAARGVQECRGATSPWTGTQPCEVRVLATVEEFGLGRRSTGTKVSLILWSPADVIPSTCGSGGTGRRASLRSLFPKGSGGSSPLFRTTQRSRRSANFATRFCQCLADTKPIEPIGHPPLVGVLRPIPHNYWTYAAKLCNIISAPEYCARRGLVLTFTFCGKGDRSMRTRLRLYRYSGFGWLRAVCAAAHLRAPHFYRATVEMTADGQV
jgi:hypothetical protein